MPEHIFEIDSALVNDAGEAVMKPEYKGKLLRCRECLYFRPMIHTNYCERGNLPVICEEDEYCSRAEERDTIL